MTVFFEPIDLRQWNLFEKVSQAGHVEPFLATKKMHAGDMLLLYVGKQVASHESGVYAYGTIMGEPYILKGRPEDYCNERLSVDVRIDELRFDKPIISWEEAAAYVGQVRSRHAIASENQDFFLGRCSKYSKTDVLKAKIQQVDKDLLAVLIPHVLLKNSAITFGSLSKDIEKQLGVKYNHHVGFNVSLGRIQEVCDALDLPCLSAMVVNNKWELPKGFYDFYRPRHPEKSSASDSDIRREEQIRCGEHKDWSSIVDFYGLKLDSAAMAVDTREYVEGATRITQKLAKEVERSSAARNACLKAHGTRCVVCGFDSEAVYGVPGIIHVHHKNPLAQSTGERAVDPVKDLVPVCPNCHYFIHSKPNGLYTIEEAMLAFEKPGHSKPTPSRNG